jgi:hypothetical protein
VHRWRHYGLFITLHITPARQAGQDAVLGRLSLRPWASVVMMSSRVPSIRRGKKEGVRGGGGKYNEEGKGK